MPFESAEISQDVQKWSLNSDEKLLESLRKFSADVTVRAKSLIDNVENLTSETVQADVRLHNTFNEFLMLSDSQFIESRVYEDDDASDAEEDTVKVEAEVDVKHELVESLRLGMEALKLFFNMDDEDTSGGPSTDQEEKLEDIYNIRPLPYIIGTQAFMDSPDAGLGDGHGGDDLDGDDSAHVIAAGSDSDASDEEVEESDTGAGQVVPYDRNSRGGDKQHHDNDDEGDESSDYSEDETSESRPQRSVVPRMPIPPRRSAGGEDELSDEASDDESFEAPRPHRQQHAKPLVSQPRYSEDDDNSEDLFGDSGNGESTGGRSGANVNAPVSIKDALNAQLAGKISAPTASASTEGGKGSTAAAPASSSYADEDEDEDDDDMFGGNQEDPYSLFGAAPVAKKKSKGKPADSMSDLFGSSRESYDDNDGPSSRSDSFASVDSLFGGGMPTARKGPANKASFSGLFGDGNEDSLFDEVEDDTMAKPAKPVVATTASTTGNKPSLPIAGGGVSKSSGGLFDDDDGDMFAAPSLKKQDSVGAKKGLQSLGASDLFSGGGLFDDDDAVDDPFGASKAARTTTSTAAKSTTPNAKAAAQPAAARKNLSSLFGDDDDDGGLFGDPKPKPQPQTAAAPVAKKAVTGGGGLFGDDDGDDDAFFGGSTKTKASAAPAAKSALAGTAVPVTKKVATSGLFGDDDDDDDLFGSKPKAKVPAAAPVATKPAAVSAAPVTKKAAVSDLFGDDDDDGDLFGAPKPKAKPAPIPVPVATAAPPTSTNKSDLFGGSDDDGDLFGSKPKPAASSHKPPAGAQATAFTAMAAEAMKKNMPQRPASNDDDDGEEDEDDPFGTAPTKAKPTPSAAPVSAPVAAPSTSAEPATKKAANSDLFGDDNNDGDLFKDSTKKPLSQVETQSTAAPVGLPAVEAQVKKAPLIAPADETSVPSVSPSPGPAAATNRPVSSKLASRMSALDPSKIIMPGMAPPPKFKKPAPVYENADESGGGSMGDGGDGKATRVHSASESGEIVNVTMDRATVKKSTAGKSRKAPTRKKAAISEEPFLVTPVVESADAVMSAPVTSPPPASSAKPAATKRAAALFGDCDDTESPAPVPLAEPVVVAPVSKPAASRDLFGDEDGGLFSGPATSKQSPAPVLPAAKPVAVAKSTGGGLFGDDDDDGGLFGGSTGTKKASLTPTPAPKPVPAASKATGGLFGDDNDGGLFSGPTTNKQSSVPAPVIPAKPAAVTKPAGGGLFGDDDDGGLFGGGATVKTAPAAKPAAVAKSTGGGLFGDDDDDGGLFGGSTGTKKASLAPTPAPKPVPAASKASSLFGDDDDDLFGGATKPTIAATKPKPAVKKSSSLFGDDDEDDPLFGGAGKAKKASSSSKGLFDD